MHMPQTTQATDPGRCSVCKAEIQPHYLMCIAHWRLVPNDLQRAVKRTWASFRLCLVPARRLQRLRFYRDASAAATASVQQQITSPEKGTQP